MKSLVIAAAILAMATVAHAETFTVSFAFTGQADSFTLFERVGDQRMVLKEGIPAAQREFTFEADKPATGCRTIFLSAIHLGTVGPYSNTAGICADPVLPDFYSPPSQPTGLVVTGQ
ncbi:MAG: hypothetical protein KQH59_18110 [Desulfobulbaceae bacterium]|nr:hypothetical protein [Desulfobulbaceae bacterium]